MKQIMMVAVLVAAMGVWAGPVEEARALLAAGRLGEVDAALGEVLMARPTNKDAQMVSFEAAVRDGRYYTAERRAISVLEMRERPDPLFLYQAARVAERLGKLSVMRDRLIYFVELEAGATAEAKAALESLCADATSPKFYERYVAQFGESEKAWTAGMAMLRTLREQGKTDDYLALLRIMFGTWNAKGAEYGDPLTAEWATAGQSGQLFGLKRSDVINVRTANRFYNPDPMQWMIDQWGDWNVDPILTMQETMGSTLMPMRLYNRVNNVNQYPEAERPALLRRIWALRHQFLAHEDLTYVSIPLQALQSYWDFSLANNVMTGDEIMAFLSAVMTSGKVRPNDNGWIPGMVEWMLQRGVGTAEQRIALVNSAPRHFLTSWMVNAILMPDVREREAKGEIRQIFERSGNRADVAWAMIDTANFFEDFDFVCQAFRLNALASPIGADYGQMNWYLQSAGIPLNVKLGDLREVLARTGFTGDWDRLMKNVPDVTVGEVKLAETEEWKAFAATVTADRVAATPLAQAVKEFVAFPRVAGENINMESLAAAKKVIEAWEGVMTLPPQGDADRVWLFNRFWDHAWELYRETSQGATAFVELMYPKMGPGLWTDGRFSQYARRRDNRAEAENYHTFVRKTVEVGKAYTGYWDIQEPGGTAEPAYADYIAAFTPPGHAIEYIQRNHGRWTPEAYARMIGIAARDIPLDTLPENNQAQLAGMLWAVMRNAELAKQVPWEQIRPKIIEKRNQIRPEFFNIVINDLMVQKRNEEAIDLFFQGLPETSDPVVAFNRVIWFTAMQNPDDGNDHVVRWNRRQEEETPIMTLGFFRDRVFPLYRAVPVDQRNRLGAPTRTMSDLDNIRGNFGQGLSEDMAGRIMEIENMLVDILLAGGSSGWWNENWRFVAPLSRRMQRMLADGQYTELQNILPIAARYAWATGYYDGWNVALRAMAEASRWESVYTLSGLLAQMVTDGNMLANLTKMRADAASNMPGIYPVTEGHPAYPLFVAADELERRNTERAWLLLRTNVDEFEKDPLRYAPAFTAWAVEQLRLVRGDRDVYQLRAKAMIDQMLVNEMGNPAELNASLILTRAEIARDQKQFDIARSEYQAIRQHPVYQRTAAGRRAMFRDVDLMVEMGNVSSAEQMAEQWLMVPDAEVQAQAYFVLARIAFDRQEFQETRKMLDKVFAIEFAHTEARLLHGKWRLETGYELDDPEVIVDGLTDRTVLRPGQPLSITVQDRNLGVAGGGASIPITITTSVGGDRETVLLYPSTRDPYLFRGIIDTTLGQARQNNAILEVRGDDIVSYSVDVDYLRARGLEPTPPKQLRIVDDAAIAVGAAMPDATAANAREELERELSGGVPVDRFGQPRALSSALRPGSPVYVAVRDRDRSMGGAADTIVVSVLTSAGDTMDTVELREIAPFTGIFQTEIATRLPPPRATASDTAAGMNPGDVINSTKSGTWRSLPDGRKGKWFDADTMGSHLMASASLVMPRPADIIMLRVYGRLADDDRLIGTYPTAAAEDRSGVRLQRMNANLRDASEMRRHIIAQGVPAVPVETWSTQIGNGNWGNYRTRLAGAIFSEARQRVRLRFVPLSDQGSIFHELDVTLILDGQVVFNGRGPNLRHQVVQLDLEKGPRLLEVFASMPHPRNEFMLGMELPNGAIEPLPPEWSDAAVHPELTDFLADKIMIERTDTGFDMAFVEPTRLRALRFEFMDFSGNEVALDKVIIEDADGRTILPADRDYSEPTTDGTLKVAPGDSITVTYLDEVTTRGERRILEKTLASSFHDAKIQFLYEDMTLRDRRYDTVLFPAYRLRQGDSLLLQIFDPDMDVTPGLDELKVRVSNQKGQIVELIARETLDHYGRPTSGTFSTLVRTIAEDDRDAARAEPDVLRVAKDDILTAIYMDAENTYPGIPIERTTTVQIVPPMIPEWQIYQTWNVLAEDRSDEAKANLLRIKRRVGNERVERVMTTVNRARPLTAAEQSAEVIAINAQSPLPIRVLDTSRALHQESVIQVEAVSQYELTLAEQERRRPDTVTVNLQLGGGFPGVNIVAQEGDRRVADANTGKEWFGGILRLRMLSDPPRIPQMVNYTYYEDPELPVVGGDRVRLSVLDENGKAIKVQWLQLVSGAQIRLTDSTFVAERNSVHLNERIFVAVTDLAKDISDAQDSVTIEVESVGKGITRTMTLTETLPHSGVFTGSVRPVFFGDREIPETLEDTLPVEYGDEVIFRYANGSQIPGVDADDVITATATVFKGADGSVRSYSKRFRDADQAVLVQFRLAECLFETAKEFRRMRQPERSTEAIAEGREILEMALRDYPGTSHAAKGEYLLANLYEELAAEEKQAGNMDAARPLYQEAIARFSTILSIWPDGEEAPRSQYHKALCLEMIEDYNRASEEYVKMTYLYPDSPLVGDAAIRLATYYYVQEKKYDVAGRIYSNFQKRFPTHPRAVRALFLGAQCHLKQAEVLAEEAKQYPEYAGRINALVIDEYKSAIEALQMLMNTYQDSTDKDLRAQAMYWAGDASLRMQDYQNAYLFLKRTTFEYPETEWARRARGLLLQESRAFERLDQ